MLKTLARDGDVEGVRRYAIEVLRLGNVDDDLAAAMADALEAKKRRGRPADDNMIDRARAVLEALDSQPRDRRRNLKAAKAKASEALGITTDQAHKAWVKYGKALITLREEEAEGQN